MTNLYYIPPSDEAFEDMRSAAIKVWGQYVDSPDYMAEKIGRIKDIKNVGDNFVYILAMFDIDNQRKCIGLLQKETKDAVRDRLLACGYEPDFLLAVGL